MVGDVRHLGDRIERLRLVGVLRGAGPRARQLHAAVRALAALSADAGRPRARRLERRRVRRRAVAVDHSRQARRAREELPAARDARHPGAANRTDRRRRARQRSDRAARARRHRRRGVRRGPDVRHRRRCADRGRAGAARLAAADPRADRSRDPPGEAAPPARAAARDAARACRRCAGPAPLALATAIAVPGVGLRVRRLRADLRRVSRARTSISASPR